MGKREARAIAAAVHKRVNGERDKRGHEPTRGSMQLASTAENYARKLAHSDTIGHHVDGNTPAERCQEFKRVRENIVRVSARGSPDRVARRAVEWWLSSPEHCDNLLSADVTRDGVGAWIHHGDAYIVQDFAAERRSNWGLFRALKRLIAGQ